MTQLPMLKGCPWCRSPNVRFSGVEDCGPDNSWQAHVFCSNCDASGPVALWRDTEWYAKRSAAILWNTLASRDPEAASLAFDLLEGLKTAWRNVDPAKSDDIAAGFARGTGGIDVDWLIEKLGPDPEAAKLWQPIETAPKDGTWILIRGRNSANRPMIPVVCAWSRGGSVMGELAWRDSASGRDVGHLIADVPPDGAADWMPLTALGAANTPEQQT